MGENAGSGTGDGRGSAPSRGGRRRAIAELADVAAWTLSGLVGVIGAVLVLLIAAVAMAWFAGVVVEQGGRAIEGLSASAGAPDAGRAIGLVIGGLAMGGFGAVMIRTVVRCTRTGDWRRYPTLEPLPMRVASLAVGAAFVLMGLAAFVVLLGVNPGETGFWFGARALLALLGIACLAIGGIRARRSAADRSVLGVAGWIVVALVGAWMLGAGFRLWPVG